MRTYGRPRADESRNVFWLALPSFGEPWHNSHHASPASAQHGAVFYFAWGLIGLALVTEAPATFVYWRALRGRERS